MGKPILAVCDSDQLFTETMTGVFREKKGLPFVIHGFSDCELLKEYLEHDPVELLLISEGEYERYEEKENVSFMVILRESEDFDEKGHHCIPKYRSASALYRNVMDLYSAEDQKIPAIRKTADRPMIFGVYSPVRRCTQTSLALTMGDILSGKGPCLYLNFEWYSGFEILMGKRFSGNMTDLLYYFQCDRERFPYRFESLIHKMGDLDYIPPGNSYVDYCGVTREEWMDFMATIFSVGHYTYVVMDLTEQVMGLFDLMKMCDHIVTICLEDPISTAKMAQYELLLEKLGCEEVKEKTYKCRLPKMTRTGYDPGKMTGTELLREVKRILADLERTRREREGNREDAYDRQR